MKKFLKFLLVIVLICVSVGTTVFLFYKSLHPKVDYFTELNTYTQGSENVELAKNLNEVYTKTSASASGYNRFSLVIETNEKLNACLNSLSSYFVTVDDHKINERKIEKSLSNLKSMRAQTNSVMQAYLLKTQAQLVPSEATPSYLAFTSYFVEYANLINLINSELGNFKLNKDTNLKFSLIEIYCNVCINTFQNLNITSTEVKNSTNINTLNQHLNFNHSYLDFNTNSFSYLTNSFVKYYNLSNKVEFANNLTTNLTTGKQDSAENELLAGYYLNLIFGE